MTRAVEAIIFSSKIVHHGAEDINKSFAGSTLVWQLHFGMIAFRNCIKILSRVLHLPEGTHFHCSLHLCLKHQNLGWHSWSSSLDSHPESTRFAWLVVAARSCWQSSLVGFGPILLHTRTPHVL
jgi:hypothetical protein